MKSLCSLLAVALALRVGFWDSFAQQATSYDIDQDGEVDFFLSSQFFITGENGSWASYLVLSGDPTGGLPRIPIKSAKSGSWLTLSGSTNGNFSGVLAQTSGSPSVVVNSFPETTPYLGIRFRRPPSFSLAGWSSE